MADASGLSAAQATANEIPYKNIALGNPAETFLNAWALASNVNLKKQEFMGKMQSLVLKNQDLEQKGDFQERKFNWDIQKNAQDYQLKLAAAGRAEDFNNIRLANYELRDTIARNKMDEQSKEIEDTQNANLYLQQQGTRPGTLENVEANRQAKLLFPRWATKQSDIDKYHDDVANKMTADVERDISLTLKNAGQTFNLPGGATWSNMDVFLHPEKTLTTFQTEQSDAEKAQGKPSIPSPQGHTMRTDAATGLQTEVKYKKDPKTGALIESPNIGLYLPPSVPGGPESIVIAPKDDWVKYYQKFTDLKKREDELPAKITAPTQPGAPIRIYSQTDFLHIPTGRGIKYIWYDPTTQQDRVGVKE